MLIETLSLYSDIFLYTYNAYAIWNDNHVFITATVDFSLLQKWCLNYMIFLFSTFFFINWHFENVYKILTPLSYIWHSMNSWWCRQVNLGMILWNFCVFPWNILQCITLSSIKNHHDHDHHNHHHRRRRRHCRQYHHQICTNVLMISNKCALIKIHKGKFRQKHLLYYLVLEMYMYDLQTFYYN